MGQQLIMVLLISHEFLTVSNVSEKMPQEHFPLTSLFGISKKLPKANCGECGVPTCLAFAMILASGQPAKAACPYVSEQAKAELEQASAPPIRPLAIGTGDKTLKIDGRRKLQGIEMINNEILRWQCQEEVLKRYGGLNDIPYELANTIASLYYEFLLNKRELDPCRSLDLPGWAQSATGRDGLRPGQFPGGLGLYQPPATPCSP